MEVTSAALIWLLLVLLAVAAWGALAIPGVRHPRQLRTLLRDRRDRRAHDVSRQEARAHEARRYADEIAVAAQGAEARAQRLRESCLLAQSLVDLAWARYQEADAMWDRARGAAAFITPERMPEEADRVRALRRAAQAAYRRGDLSADQLMDALTHRRGWDPHLHPVEQELALARATVVHRAGLYQQAVDAQHDAWRASEVATAAVRSLRRELSAANARADEALTAPPTRAIDEASAHDDPAGGDETVVVTDLADETRTSVDENTVGVPVIA